MATAVRRRGDLAERFIGLLVPGVKELLDTEQWSATRRRLLVPVVVTFAALLVLAPSALAEGGPQWSISSVSRPTNFRPGDDAHGDEFVVLVTNTGAAASSGAVTITDQMPLGLEPAAGASGEDLLIGSNPGGRFSSSCGPAGEEREVSCTYTGVVPPDDTLMLSFPVKVTASEPTSLNNVVSVSGGGAPSAAMPTPTAISAEPAGFGVSVGGASSTLSSVQAGAHADLTVSTAFNTEDHDGATVGNLKDTTFELPPGFAGDLVDTPQCAGADFLREQCPVATQVGVATVVLSDTSPVPGPNLVPVYNLAPEPGAVAKLGFPVQSFHYEGDVTVRQAGEAGAPAGEPGEPYGLKTTFFNATAGPIEVDDVALTVWGVPAAPVHDPLRVRSTNGEAGFTFGASSNATQAPYLSNPTSCALAPLSASFSVTSWQHPTESPPATVMPFGPIVGCDALVMEPALTAEVSSSAADAPTGLEVATKIPQTYANATGLSTPTLKKEVVTLPEGMTVNPSSGAGLAACSEAQYAEEGTQFVAGSGCPNSSKLATVRIVTPSLREEALGSVFLAQPAPFGEAGRNPFNSLLSVYLIAHIANRGVLIKSPGLVQANELTGQLTTTFDDLPPLPFSLATFSFNQGANAPLVTPPACRSYSVTAALTPYSEPGAAPLTPLVPPFAIFTNCPTGGIPPFAPQVLGGTVSNTGGSYSPLYLRISRNDGEQEITGFSSQLPAGLTANLNGIPLCSEAQVAAARHKTGAQEEAEPSCPPASAIGHSIAEAGVGTVLAQTAGKIYLGGPLEGAPFSIVSITSAKVGPFDLGTVIVHLPLQIDPDTAAVTIPSGVADQIPHIIKGIVIHLRTIRVYVDRPDFMLNPTSCAPMSLAATVIGGGADPANPADQVPVTVSDRFQAADCQALAFKPSFHVSTAGKTSKANGASLTVKLAYPNAPQGTQANIRFVKVELPLQLPSRLTTLQKACRDTTFDANPAACPPGSIVGHATAVTPILPVPLAGPAYFVSHGNAKFPELIIVLQGYGVTIHLHGETFISKAGITSSTFRTVPDQPVTSFQLTLPQQSNSALAASTNLCSLTRTIKVRKTIVVRRHGHVRRIVKLVKKNVHASLNMPTTFIAQNGRTIHQNTHITVTGCSKRRPQSHKTAKRRKT
jgi:hypothetical protein